MTRQNTPESAIPGTGKDAGLMCCIQGKRRNGKGLDTMLCLCFVM